MNDNLHIVNFDLYCPACKHFNKNQNEEPCDTCLGIPARKDSRKPAKWEEPDNGIPIKKWSN